MVEVIATIFEITFGKRKEWIERRGRGGKGIQVIATVFDMFSYPTCYYSRTNTTKVSTISAAQNGPGT